MKRRLEKSKFINIIDKYKKTGLFILIFILIAITIFYRNEPFYYDAKGYWNLSYLFDKNNIFDFLKYNNELRGYLFPYVLFLIRLMAPIFDVQDKTIFIIVFSLFNSFFITILIPKISELIFKRKVSFKSLLICSIIIIFYWNGYFGQALSDLPSLYTLMVVIYFLLLFNKKEKKLYTYSILIGLFLSMTTNIRPSYQILIPVVICLFVWLNISKFKNMELKKLKILKKTTINVIFIVIGFLVISYPQYLVNKTHFKKQSIFVESKLEGKNLFASQLWWGTEIQKYETHVGDSQEFGQSLKFIDKSGSTLMIKNNMTIEDGVDKYFDLVVKNPFIFGKIYFKHIFNGLDIKYSTPYIKDVYDTNWGYSIVNYTIIYLFILTFYKKIKTKQIFSNEMLIITTIVGFSILILLPVAIEVRFFLPLYIFAYIMVFYSEEFNNIFNKNYLIKKLKQLKLEQIVIYLLFLVVCIVLSIGTYESYINFPIIQ